MNRLFDNVMGLLKSIQAGVGGGSSVQNLAYTWDSVGNLLSRKDVNQSNLTESFTYDDLYRLKSSELNGATTLQVSYDELGNITNKSDVGSYTYDATKKHQLVSTSNDWTFTYDNNGNMLTGRGAATTWTSFNYPASITNGGLYSQFSYAPDRQYFKQVAQYSDDQATTFYIGGLLEKVTVGDDTDYKHMIVVDGARIIVSRRTDGPNLTWYSFGDSLGSSSTVTTISGAVQFSMSYTAFGARRGSNWQGNPSSGDWANIAGISRHGFTDHSMLDNLNLIHMNGRIYDSLLGRMMSADPTIPGNSTQAFNRYSYVANNPLSLIDPSGFAPGENDHRRQYEDGDGGVWGNEEVARNVATSRWASQWVGGQAPRVWAFSGRGWFELNHMQGYWTSNGPLQFALYPGSQGAAHSVEVEPLDPLSGEGWKDTFTTRPYGPTGCIGFCSYSFFRDNPVGHFFGRLYGDGYAPYNDGVNPITGEWLVPGEVNDIKVGTVLSLASLGLEGLIPAAARGATQSTALSTYRYTQAGEKFIRYESGNPAFSRVTPSGGVRPGTYAAPASDGVVPAGQRVSTYNLPDPQIPRPNYVMLEPPAGTPIIGPGPVMGGTGNEVIFPFGF
jgi:RHS repeat-associated protein